MTKPDVYHQEHPVESKELIRTKLVELNHEMEKLPLEEKKTYCLALERSPILVSDNDKLAFLRCEVFHADVSNPFGTEMVARSLYVKTWASPLFVCHDTMPHRHWMEYQ